MDQRTPNVSRRDAVLDKIVDICLAAGPVEIQTDKYFTNTARIVAANGDVEVAYAVFMRRRVVAALEPAIRLLGRLVPTARVKRFFNEGDLVPSEKKILEIRGSMAELSQIETLILQKIGFPCVSANNA
jgi:nicotinate phosphoribosyltransferase